MFPTPPKFVSIADELARIGRPKHKHTGATVEKIERVLRDYFEKVAGAKLETEADGVVHDHDSNWAFDPTELAAKIAAALED